MNKLIAKYWNEIEPLLRNDELFSFANKGLLPETIISTKYSEEVILVLDELELHFSNVSIEEPELQERLILILSALQKIKEADASSETKESDPEEDSEKEPTAQAEEQAAEEEDDDDDDDDGEGAASAQAQKLIGALEKDFSYMHIIKATIEDIKRKPEIEPVFNGASNLYLAIINFLNSIKKVIKSISEFFGLKGILVGIKKLMEKSIVAEHIIKILGTLLILLLFLIFMIAYPIWRLWKSPTKIFKWLFEDVEIELPEE